MTTATSPPASIKSVLRTGDAQSARNIIAICEPRLASPASVAAVESLGGFFFALFAMKVPCEILGEGDFARAPVWPRVGAVRVLSPDLHPRQQMRVSQPVKGPLSSESLRCEGARPGNHLPAGRPGSRSPAPTPGGRQAFERAQCGERARAEASSSHSFAEAGQYAASSVRGRPRASYTALLLFADFCLQLFLARGELLTQYGEVHIGLLGLAEHAVALLLLGDVMLDHL